MSSESEPETHIPEAGASDANAHLDADPSKRATPHPKIFAATLDLAKALEQRDAALKARRRGGGSMESADIVLPSPVQRSAQLLQLRQQAQAAAQAASTSPGLGALGLAISANSSSEDSGSVRSKQKLYLISYGLTIIVVYFSLQSRTEPPTSIIRRRTKTTVTAAAVLVAVALVAVVLVVVAMMTRWITPAQIMATTARRTSASLRLLRLAGRRLVHLLMNIVHIVNHSRSQRLKPPTRVARSIFPDYLCRMHLVGSLPIPNL